MIGAGGSYAGDFRGDLREKESASDARACIENRFRILARFDRFRNDEWNMEPTSRGLCSWS